MQPILTQITFILLAFIESYHDEAVIDIQNYALPNYSLLSKKWHNYSAAYYCVLVGLVCYLSGSWLLAINLFLIRMTFLDLFLNLKRGKPAFYLGNSGFDLTMSQMLGKYAGALIIMDEPAIESLLNDIAEYPAKFANPFSQQFLKKFGISINPPKQ